MHRCARGQPVSVTKVLGTTQRTPFTQKTREIPASRDIGPQFRRLVQPQQDHHQLSTLFWPNIRVSTDGPHMFFACPVVSIYMQERQSSGLVCSEGGTTQNVGCYLFDLGRFNLQACVATFHLFAKCNNIHVGFRFRRPENQSCTFLCTHRILCSRRQG